MRKCFFVDIDGTLLEFLQDFENVTRYRTLPALPGAREKTSEWHCKGYQIILTTARPESLREITKEQLHNAGVIYDMLLMGIGSGPRILINDISIAGQEKAIAYNVKRNIDGIAHIEE